jgi:serine/threonine protein kinase
MYVRMRLCLVCIVRRHWCGVPKVRTKLVVLECFVSITSPTPFYLIYSSHSPLSSLFTLIILTLIILTLIILITLLAPSNSIRWWLIDRPIARWCGCTFQARRDCSLPHCHCQWNGLSPPKLAALSRSQGCFLPHDNGWMALVIYPRFVGRCDCMQPGNIFVNLDMDGAPLHICIGDFGETCYFSEENQPSETIGSAGFMVGRQTHTHTLSHSLPPSLTHVVIRFSRRAYHVFQTHCTRQAPEVLQKKQYGYPCDVYSFGMLMYTMMNLRPPFWEKFDAPWEADEQVAYGFRPALQKPIRDRYTWLPSLFEQCTDITAENRPNFREILRQLERPPTNIVRTTSIHDCWTPFHQAAHDDIDVC